MRFVITGTGRSGTGYTASLFNAAGLNCGHEDVFQARTGLRDRQTEQRNTVVSRLKAPAGRLKEEIRRRRLPYEGDASWLAVPRLRTFSGVSFLQLRHPVLVIRSCVGTRFFSDPTRNTAKRHYASRFFDMTGDDVTDAMRWWVVWNEMAEPQADLVYRLEDLDAELFARMLRMVQPNLADRAKQAVASIPIDVNSAARRGEERGLFSWSDLPPGHDRDAIAVAAERYDYEPDEY